MHVSGLVASLTLERKRHIFATYATHTPTEIEQKQTENATPCARNAPSHTLFATLAKFGVWHEFTPSRLRTDTPIGPSCFRTPPNPH